MYTLTPSQVVGLMNKMFGMRDASHPALDAQHSNLVAQLLVFVRRVPQGYLGALGLDDLLLLDTAIASCENSLANWRNATGKYSIPLGRLRAFRDLDPVVAIREVMAKIPDDAIPAADLELPFIYDRALAATIEQDIQTAASTFANGEYKATCVMAGSAIEALLLWAVQSVQTTRPNDVEKAARASGVQLTKLASPEEWMLVHLLKVAHGIGAITDTGNNAGDAARDLRNLVHPGRALRTQVQPTAARAHLALGALKFIVEELAEAAAARRL